MEQRDSLDGSSFEDSAVAAAAPNGPPVNGGSMPPASGQMLPSSSISNADESSPVVDSVLQSDVRHYNPHNPWVSPLTRI